jgi:hypothetical protein
MGDCAVWGNNAVTFAGGPIGGDEGTGWGLVSHFTQQPYIVTTNVGSMPAQSTCSTTLAGGLIATGTNVASVKGGSWANTSGGQITFATGPGNLTLPGNNTPALAAGAIITVSGASPSGYNGTFTIVSITGTGAANNGTSTIVVAASNPGGSASAQGTVGGPIYTGTSAIPPQTVAVASTTNCHVNDWVVIDQVLPTYAAAGSYGYPNNEAVQITAVGSGTISAVFKNNHSNGATVTPALVLSVGNTFGFGQQRKLVNHSDNNNNRQPIKIG